MGQSERLWRKIDRVIAGLVALQVAAGVVFALGFFTAKRAEPGILGGAILFILLQLLALIPPVGIWQGKRWGFWVEGPISALVLLGALSGFLIQLVLKRDLSIDFITVIYFGFTLGYCLKRLIDLRRDSRGSNVSSGLPG